MRLAEGRAGLVEIAAGGLQIGPGLVFVHKESGYRNHEGDVPIVVRIGRTLVVAAAVMLLTFFIVMTAVMLSTLLFVVMMATVVLLAAFLTVMMAAVVTVLTCDDLVERLITY